MAAGKKNKLMSLPEDALDELGGQPVAQPTPYDDAIAAQISATGRKPISLEPAPMSAGIPGWSADDEDGEAAPLPPHHPAVNPSTGVPEAVLPSKDQEPAKDPMSAMLAAYNSPERKALLEQLRGAIGDATAGQKKGIEDSQNGLDSIKNMGSQVNLAPLAALSDTWYGSKLSQGYKAPMTPEERRIKMLQLQDAINTERKGLSQTQIDELKANLTGSLDPLAQYSKLARLGNQNDLVGLRKDKQAADAAKDIHNNPLIQTAAKQLGQLQIDRHTIETSPMITPQILHEVSNGIANALSGGRGVGLGMAEMQDLSTAQTALAAMEQKILNEPKNAASPAIKQQVVDTLNRLEEAYGKYQNAVADRIKIGKTYNHNAQAQASQAAAVGAYKYTPRETPKAPKGKGTVPVNADLSKMTPEELQDYISTHGSK